MFILEVKKYSLDLLSNMPKDIHLGRGGARVEQKVFSKALILHHYLSGMCSDGEEATDWISTLAGRTHF